MKNGPMPNMRSDMDIWGGPGITEGEEPIDLPEDDSGRNDEVIDGE